VGGAKGSPVLVIPVLDLKSGHAVHARRGERHQYEPVCSRLSPAAGDAEALARAYRAALGLDSVYLADLDAISGGEPQHRLIRSIAAVGGRLLVDAGITTPDRARQVIEDGAAAVVIGLETLRSFDALSGVVRALGSGRVIFSLDMRDREPIVPAGTPHPGSPIAIVRRAVGAGVGSVIVLDLARVGTGEGVDLQLVRGIRREFHETELLVGGGVRGREDFERLAEIGCDGALVASALHDGRLGAGDLDAIRRRRPRHK
jgi:phosphoribosylformimino-5-aminoimidazole carboxamide ribotide isomerase